MKFSYLVAGLLLVLGLACQAQEQEAKSEKKEYSKPGRFDKEILNFEEMDKKKFPPPGAIVCIGSSSMKFWHPNIVEDLAPLTVIPRGFGGSNMNEAVHYADRIVIPYKPRAIVLYEGDNDIAAGIAPQQILEKFREFVEKVRKELPEVRIYYISIKPSISRTKLWPKAQETNRLIEEECAKGKNLTYIDVATPMFGPDKELRKDIFKPDNLHMTRPGYEIWRDAVKPVLLKGELAFEPNKDN